MNYPPHNPIEIKNKSPRILEKYLEVFQNQIYVIHKSNFYIKHVNLNILTKYVIKNNYSKMILFM